MTRAILFTVLTWTFLLACKEQRTSSPTTTVNTPPPVYATPAQPEPITEAPTVVNPPVFQQDNYPSGIYCALAKYFNPSSGTASYYNLTAEIDGSRMVKMYLPNGGWLDVTHFDPPFVDNDGFCSFSTDKGYRYELFAKEDGPFPVASSSGSDGDSNEEEENFDEKYGEVKAVVVKRVSGCDYMIVERNGDYYVVEWMGGNDPDESDRIQGELNRYGTKTCYKHSRSRETRLWIDDYRVSYSRAWEIIREKCDLRDDDDN